MSSLLHQALSVLRDVAKHPFAIVGLIILVLAAALLQWKRAQLKTFERTTAGLPESERLRAIRIYYGTQPQAGVSAETWLSSRKQLFVFWAYVSTLLSGLAIVGIVVGTVSKAPGWPNTTELRGDFSVLDGKLAAYELAGFNLHDAFAMAGSRAVDPDPQLDQELTRAVLAYNASYDDLQIRRAQYLQAVVRWLGDQPEWAKRVEDTVDYALNDVHSGVRGFNSFYQEALRARNQRHKAESAVTASADISAHTDAADRVRERVSDVARLLEAFRKKRQALAGEILDNG